MSKGLFVTLEGGEGSGKSTQIYSVKPILELQGFRVFATREPGGVRVSELIRSILLDPELDAMDPITELLLYNASRREMVKKLLLPALQEYDVVLMDRYFDSTVAYQGYARGIDMDTVRRLIRVAVGSLIPDLSILLDIEPAVGVARASSVEITRFEKEELEFHEKVRAGYLTIAEQEPDRVKVVDATPSPEVVTTKILEILEPTLLDLKGASGT